MLELMKTKLQINSIRTVSLPERAPVSYAGAPRGVSPSGTDPAAMELPLAPGLRQRKPFPGLSSAEGSAGSGCAGVPVLGRCEQPPDPEGLITNLSPSLA